MNSIPLPNNAQGIIPYIDLNNIPFRSAEDDRYKEVCIYPPGDINILVMITNDFCQEYSDLDDKAMLMFRGGKRYDFFITPPRKNTYVL